MKRRKPSRKASMSSILTFFVEWVVEEGDDDAYRMLVDVVGAVMADDFIKHGRSVYRQAGIPIHVRGLLTQGGGQ